MIDDKKYWYDKGYSDGVQDTIKESKIPKIAGTVSLTALLVADQYWIIGFVAIYSGFELFEWHDKRKHHESDPPEWEHTEFDT